LLERITTEIPRSGETKQTHMSFSRPTRLEVDGAASCKVSSCCVTSSAQRQLTNSCKCNDALQI